ncbi:hypothetical protein [Candidatus Pelagibacter sp. HIMB1623]|uniref:hypothetical protein n=1 Tax=Candidatus Pelagibacter sp. HIMB1623 TaxID=3413358 RepID=UPI003F85DF6C
MCRKIFYIIFITLFLNNCGFEPIYSKKVNSDFSLNSLKLTGDRTINNYLNSNLKQFKNKKFEKTFSLEISTDYKKSILTKDKTAKVSSYKLSNTTSVKVFSNNRLIKEIQISSKKNMDSIEDEFEEEKNEILTKQNFSSEIYNQIITELALLDDY